MSGWKRERQLVFVVVIVCVLLSILFHVGGNGGATSYHEVTEWLEQNNLGYINDIVIQSGGTTLMGALNLEKQLKRNSKLTRTLSKEQQQLLIYAIKKLRDSLELELWLEENQLGDGVTVDYVKGLQKLGVSSLQDLAATSENELRGFLSTLRISEELRWTMKVHHHLYNDLQNERKITDNSAFIRYMNKRNVPKKSSTALTITVVLVSVLAMLVASLSVSRHETKARIYDILTRRYSSPYSSKVTWDWSEPQTVGKTMTFGVKFFQRNGSPYPVSDGDRILVEITHEGVMVARTLEFASENPQEVNLVKCSFTVHKSGIYTISIIVSGQHIKDSPFTKVFLPGPIDPSKTGFQHYSSTVVFSAGVSHPLVIDIRDHFGNLSAYRNDNKAFFKIKVTEAGTKERLLPITQIVYNIQERKLVMHITIDKEGCFQALVSYGDVRLKNGEFDILVLCASELEKVRKNVQKSKHNLWYEARLLGLNGEKLEKPKKVYVYISPRQITLKEFYFKFYPRKLCTFRVCPRTKFTFNGTSNKQEMPLFSIDDGSQFPVELCARERNTIVATFSCFLLKSIGGSETFNDKRDFFYQEIRSLHYARSISHLQIKVNRAQLLQSSYKATKQFNAGQWCRCFEITFIGEQGLDWGGVSREWFELLSKELFDPNCSQLFTRLTDNKQGLVHPNPKRSPDSKHKMYEFAGKVVGKCLYESACQRIQLVKARFTRSFLAQLIGLRVTYKHFETDDPEFFTTKISFIENNDVEDMELTFSEEVYNDQGQLVKVVDLIPNGARIAVTNSNKLQYLDALAQYRLVAPVKEEVEHFLRGLNTELIPDNLLSIFDENELELLMCGTGTYSISDFKVHHNINGTISSKVLDWFWTIIASFTEEQMARLIQFTTGSSQLPPGGFAELNPKIQLSSAPTFNNLPSSHTCFNQLCLPDYDSMKTFHKMLLIAINEGNQGFAMV